MSEVSKLKLERAMKRHFEDGGSVLDVFDYIPDNKLVTIANNKLVTELYISLDKDTAENLYNYSCAVGDQCHEKHIVKILSDWLQDNLTEKEKKQIENETILD